MFAITMSLTWKVSVQLPPFKFEKVPGVPRLSLTPDVMYIKPLELVLITSRILASVSKSSRHAFQREESGIRTTKSGGSVLRRTTHS
jgi:hypothetical protein